MRLQAKFYRWNGVWSNIWADTADELLNFADEVLSLSRASMIDEGFATERFMINELRRQQAIREGAVPIQYGGAAMYKLIRRRRERGMPEKGL
jgi:hypothetical protein